MFLSTIFGVPYILLVHLKHLKLQKHPNRHQVWASCILLTFLVPIVTYVAYISCKNQYDKTSVAADYKINFELAFVFLCFSFFLNFVVACVYDSIANCFNCQLELSSCICPCENRTIARIVTYLIIGLVFNALHLLIPCSYTILLALVASPFHAMPVLLLYLSCIYMFVITVSESMKKGNCICVVIIILMNCVLSVLLIVSYFIMVTLIGEYSKDEGLQSVVGGLLPTSINILLGYFIREVVYFLSPKDKID